MKQMKYTIKDFREDFPDDDACLEWLKDYLYPDGIYCKFDKKITPHHKLKKRKAYSCELCGRHTYPTANTIFHKSRTPLTLWFYAVYLMSATRAGISAKQLERELGVTYKTAWRMFHQIRKMMSADDDKMSGEVEIDEMYLSADPTKNNRIKTKDGSRYSKSEVVFGMVERKGRARVKHVKGSGLASLRPVIAENIDTSAHIYSDQWPAYTTLPKEGYMHDVVNHGQRIYTRGNIHTQNVENLWSNMRRGIRGVYRHVDASYLQAYIDEYAFRYSHRNDFQPMFWAILSKLSK